MHVHLIQHGPQHTPARLTDWLASMGHSYTIFHLYAGELAPRPGDCDAMIVLDGPEDFLASPPPWSKAERKLIRRLLESHKPLLGINVGAQLIASELGAVVSRGTFAELGWHEVELADESPFDLPERFQAFMWHRNVFSLPEDALPLGGSQAAPLQGFAWDAGRVVGLLCHLEVTQQSVGERIAHLPFPEGSDTSTFVQTPQEILAEPRRFDQLAPLLDRLLSQWLRAS